MRRQGRGCGGSGDFRYCLEYIGGVGSGASDVLTDHVLELLESTRLDVELPVEVLAHLALHLVDPPKLEHALADYQPGLVRIGIVADHLGGDHEHRDEETVAG